MGGLRHLTPGGSAHSTSSFTETPWCLLMEPERAPTAQIIPISSFMSLHENCEVGPGSINAILCQNYCDRCTVEISQMKQNCTKRP